MILFVSMTALLRLPLPAMVGSTLANWVMVYQYTTLNLHYVCAAFLLNFSAAIRAVSKSGLSDSMIRAN